MQVIASATSWLQHHLLQLHGPLVYVVVGALVFIEVGIAIGVFVPGEIATIVGGVIASQHHANLLLMVAVVAGAATIGNLSGYELGRVVGPWLLDHRPLKGSSGVSSANRLVAKRGGPAVLIGRWIAVVRAVLPGLAGMSNMDRRTFVFFSAVGGIGWGTMWVLVGYAAGLSYAKVVKAAGQWSLVALGVVAVFVALLVAWHKLRERRRSEDPGPAA
ncbi:MAG: DedA family protein [Acidimicrobiales bacterium]